MVNVTHPAHNEPAGPCLMVIFGATGDLTKRLLVPSLYNSRNQNFFPRSLRFSDSPPRRWTLRDFGTILRTIHEFSGEPVDEGILGWLTRSLLLTSGDFGNPASFDHLRSELEKAEREQGTEGNRLFYFAVAPKFISELAKQLHLSKLSCEEDGRWRRIVVEKPFGSDLRIGD